jgi:hypothetical protein
MHIRRAAALAAVTLVTTLVPRDALACPVCFGQNDSAMAVAMNAGVLMMLGVVVVMLGLFASFIFYLARRARLAPEPSGSTDYRRSHPQEGTVRC